VNYLLDTNICIYIIKKKPIEVFHKLRSFPDLSVGISSISIAELEYGVRKSSKPEANQAALKYFLTPLQIVHFDQEAAFEYGIIRSKLEKQGTLIGPLDMLIAAHARSLKLTLITNNVHEFSRVEGLKIENWVISL
jgi:tRNA(fMet)-specific endonuclease VapC